MAAKYLDTITDRAGNALAGAIVQAIDSNGALQTLYDDPDLLTPIGLSAATNDNGLVTFYIPDGTYTIQQNYAGISASIQNVELFDLGDLRADVNTSTADKANASALGITASDSTMGAFTTTIIPDNSTAKGALEAVASEVSSVSKSVITQESANRRKVVGKIPFVNTDTAAQLALFSGITHFYPQGFTVDLSARELFLIRDGAGVAQVVEIYDYDTLQYKSCFFPYVDASTPMTVVSESLVVKWEGASRKLYLRSSTYNLHKYDVTTPTNLNKVVSEELINCYTGIFFDYCEGMWYVADDYPLVGVMKRRNQIIKYDDDWNRRGHFDIKLANVGAGATSAYSNTYIAKRQGFKIAAGGILLSCGGRRSGASDFGEYRNQGIRFVNASGDVFVDALCRNSVFRGVLSDAGFVTDFVENEGVFYDDQADVVLSLFCVNDETSALAATDGMLLLQEFCTDPDALNFAGVSTVPVLPLVDYNGLYNRSGDGRMYNPVTGDVFLSWGDIIRYMRNVDMTDFSFYSSSVSYLVDCNGNTLPSGLRVFIFNCNNGTFFVKAFGNAAERSWRVVYDSGADTFTQNDAMTYLGGTGSPEGSVTAPIGTLYVNKSGGAGTTLYVKESGTGTTGWVAK